MTKQEVIIWWMKLGLETRERLFHQYKKIGKTNIENQYGLSTTELKEIKSLTHYSSVSNEWVLPEANGNSIYRTCNYLYEKKESVHRY